MPTGLEVGAAYRPVGEDLGPGVESVGQGGLQRGYFIMSGKSVGGGGWAVRGLASGNEGGEGLGKGRVGMVGRARGSRRSSARRPLRRLAAARPAADAGGPVWGSDRPSPRWPRRQAGLANGGEHRCAAPGLFIGGMNA